MTSPTSPRLSRRAVLAGLVVLGLGGCAVGSREPPVRARVVWRFQAVGDVLGLASASGLVLAGTSRGAVHALDAATGSHEWAESLLLRAARPTVVGTLLAASDTTDTYGLRIATGRRAWQVSGTLLAAGEAAIVVRSRWSESPEAGILTAHDPETGEARWTLPWSGSAPTAALSGDAVHLRGTDRIVTVAARTGAPLWERRVTAGPPPVAGGASVILVDDGALTCLDARTGVVSWRAAGPVAGLLSMPGTLVCAAGGDRIAAWHATTGEEAWTWSADEAGAGGSAGGGPAGVRQGSGSTGGADDSGSDGDGAGGDPGPGGGDGGSTGGPDTGSGAAAVTGPARDLRPAAPADGTVVLTADVTVPPATDGRRVAVLALDARSGDLRWRLDLPDPSPSGARAGPVATGTGLVVAASGSWICAISTTTGP